MQGAGIEIGCIGGHELLRQSGIGFSS